MGGTRGREDVRGAKIAGRSPPFLGREREASVLMLIRSAVARATIRPVLLLSSASGYQYSARENVSLREETEEDRWLVYSLYEKYREETQTRWTNYEVTVSSEQHAQAERTKKQEREEKAASSGHRCSVSLLNKCPPLFPAAPFRRLGSLFPWLPFPIEPN